MYSVKPAVFLKNVKTLAILTVSIFFIQRLILFLWSLPSIKFDLVQTIKAFFLGFIFDTSLLIYTLIPLVLFTVLFPKFKAQKTAKNAYFIGLNLINFFFIFFVLYMAISELFFWDEFTARYNFIAVDYLIYTTEVLKNIWESYPTFKILLGLT